jgi:hypothetical protein
MYDIDRKSLFFIKLHCYFSVTRGFHCPGEWVWNVHILLSPFMFNSLSIDKPDRDALFSNRLRFSVTLHLFVHGSTYLTHDRSDFFCGHDRDSVPAETLSHTCFSNSPLGELDAWSKSQMNQFRSISITDPRIPTIGPDSQGIALSSSQIGVLQCDFELSEQHLCGIHARSYALGCGNRLKSIPSVRYRKGVSSRRIVSFRNGEKRIDLT